MLKLKLPLFTYAQALNSCTEGITGNNELLVKINNNKQHLQTCAMRYCSSASTEELYTIPPTQNTHDANPLILNELTKSDLIKLYSTYFVDEKKPARTIYNSLIAGANEKCPFCGGIGRPRNLDHYLPKSHYPQYSILPVNLIPSCRDCNMDGKGVNFATHADEQLLQPYLDNNRYFDEQWVFARYIAGNRNEPGVIEYFVQPPDHWDNTHKNRVKKHFHDFDLALRFSKEAGPRLITYLAQINALLALPLELDVVKMTILQPAIDTASFANHWEKVMCMALMDQLT